MREAAEVVIGNLDDDGYLTGSEEELLGEGQAEAVEEPPAAEAAESADAGANGTEHRNNVIPMPRPAAPYPR